MKGLTQNQTETPNPKDLNHALRSKSSTQHANPHTTQHPTKHYVNPPATSKRPRPNPISNPNSSTGYNMDDDIQEVVPVKTEPRDIPPTTTTAVSKPSKDLYTTDNSNSLAHLEDDSYGYQLDQQVEYEQYEDYGHGTAVEGSASYEATGQSEGIIIIVYSQTNFPNIQP